MPVHLNEYEALIQLLIGSVFIAMLFQREDFLSEIRQTFTSRISIPNYELVSEDEWKQRLKTLRKSIMVVLATYGCMVLYYCANFHLNNHIDSKTALIIIEISPTLSGIALLSFCVTIYQIITIFRPVSRMRHSYVLITYLVIMVIIFIIFVLIFPDSYALNLTNFMGQEEWENYGKKVWETIVNSWVLINLFIWIIVYFKIYHEVIILTFKLTTDDAITSQIGIENRLKYILECINNEQGHFKQQYLKKRAKEELEKDKNYFTEEELENELNLKTKSTTGSAKYQVTGIEKDDAELTKKLKEIIDTSNLSGIKKKRLKKSVKCRAKWNRPPQEQNQKQGAEEFFNVIQNEKNALIKKNADKLCNLGFLKKTEVGDSWLKKSIRWFKNIIKKS